MHLYDDIIITGNRAISRSFAKINLTLDVLSRRPDGYHDVEMVMQSINLFDLVIVDRCERDITLSTNLKYLPANDKNIAYKAAALFFQHAGCMGGAKILIHKNIPVAAGLAGGSANAAAVLCCLNKLYQYPFSWEEILNMGAELGADVPFCIHGGTALSAGIGERLTPLAPMPDCALLLVKPPVSVSTAIIYDALDHTSGLVHPDNTAMLQALRQGDLESICKLMGNIMEHVTGQMHPCIFEIKKQMLTLGASCALMSGSGPTVFSVFTDERAAKKAADQFSKKYREVFLCAPAH